jgi:hypothetical protein
MKEMIKSSRNEFLKDKNRKNLEIIKKKDEINKKMQEKEIRINQRKKSTKLFDNLLNKFAYSFNKKYSTALQNLCKEPNSSNEPFRKYHPPSKLMSKEYYENFYPPKKGYF